MSSNVKPLQGTHPQVKKSDEASAFFFLFCLTNEWHSYFTIRQSCSSDLPGGPMVKNPPTSAGDLGSIPGLGRPHVPGGNQAHIAQLLSPRTLEPKRHNKSHFSQKPVHRS